MSDERLLIVRLGSLGDIVHTLPAAAALRDAFPGARIDWVVDKKWTPLLDGNPDVSRVIALDRSTWRGLRQCIGDLRRARYTRAIDFQGLYKSAVLAFFSGARVRFGYQNPREGPARLFYTARIEPAATHVVDRNLALAKLAGAKEGSPRFPLCIPADAEAEVGQQLAARGVRDFVVLSPGGGWRSKCWPAERYAQLHNQMMADASFAGWQSVINFGPGERELAEQVFRMAREPKPVLIELSLPQLMAVLRRAKLFVGGDTGPLHLSVALGTPVVGLYGPTDPARNGPYCVNDVVVRNARAGETTYKREDEHASSMLTISVEQVMDAVVRRLRVET